MTELDERIRSFIDFNVTPVSADEIIGINVDRGGAGTPRRRLRRRRLLLMCGAVAVVIAIVSVGLVTFPGPKGTNVPRASAATAKTFLDSVALHADSQKALIPGPNEYLYVATISSQTNGEALPPLSKMFWYDSDELTQTWTSPRAASHQSYRIVGRPIFLSAGDRSLWVLEGSKPLGSGNGTGPPPPYYDVTSLPTKPAAMIAYLGVRRKFPKSHRTRANRHGSSRPCLASFKAEHPLLNALLSCVLLLQFQGFDCRATHNQSSRTKLDR